MTTIIDYIINISALISFISLFAMSAYLYRAKIYTAWQLRTYFLWPRLLFEYRDHTRKYSGKIGIWFPIFKVSFLILSGVFVSSSVPQLFSLPTPILIIILIFAVTVIPALGYAIYGLSKEKYY